MSDESDNLYAPPKSPLTVATEDEFVEAAELRDKLVSEQSFLRVFIVAFVGSIIGVLVLAGFLITPGIFFLAFALPGAITGFAIRHFGKALDPKYRLFGGFVTLATYWLLIENLNPSSVLFGFMLSLLNAIVAGYISRRSLSPEEEAAIYLRRFHIE